MSHAGRPRIRRAGVAAIVCGALVTAATAISPTAPAASHASKSPTGGNWTVYHRDPTGAGIAGTIRLARARQAWVSPTLDGQLYGEPLVAGQRVIVATENDTVYSLDARTGRVRWSNHLGAPVPSSALPCGNISPVVGITSTPVIDIGRNEVFVVADVRGTAGPVHELIGLALTSGAIELRQEVDPPDIDTAAVLQRVALTLDGGRVVFGYGGNYGDCASYHGWVVSAPEDGGPITTYELDSAPGQERGAVWMGGAAPVIDPSGNIWVSVGNGSVQSSRAPYDGSDSVIELSPSLELLQYFAPPSWASDNLHDADLGSSAPALLTDGLVFQAGKSGTAYLLSQTRLGGVGGQLASLTSFCDGNVEGGSSVNGTTIYVPCQNGVIAVSVGSSPPTLHVLWQASGVGGPPILAGGFVWAIDSGGNLDALNRATGAMVQQFALGSVANHFPTPSVGAGRLFATGAERVFAFAGG